MDCACHSALDVARASFVRRGVAQRVGAYGTTPQFSSLRFAVLVGVDSRTTRTDGLWRCRSLRVHDITAQWIAWRTADLFEFALVSIVCEHNSIVVVDAAGGSAVRRVDHVDTRGTGIRCRGLSTVRGLAARVRNESESY